MRLAFFFGRLNHAKKLVGKCFGPIMPSLDALQVNSRRALGRHFGTLGYRSQLAMFNDGPLLCRG